ncbi:MAG: hypothetical protein ABJE47_09980 [bacterium]
MPNERVTRTAIIAVHGVGSPPRFDTARGIADLLTQYGCASAACSYPSFSEQFIKIPTSPLVIPPEAGGKAAQPQERAPRFSKRISGFTVEGRDRTTFAPDDITSDMDLDVAFMRDQLVGYEARSRRVPYNTIEICGARVRDTPHGQVEDEVHIYEMHWADLSRIGTGVLSVIGALYQLTLHIAHLGRKTLDLASAAAMRRPKSDNEAELWSKVSFWHAWVLRFFTVGVPVFSMLLLGCVILFLPDALAPRKRLVIGVVLLELALLIGIGLRAYFRDRARNAAGKLIGFILAFAAAGIAAVVFSASIGGNSLGVVLLNTASIGLVLLAYLVIINRYDSVAPGALPWGAAGLVVMLAGMAYWGPRFVRGTSAEEGEGLRYVAFVGFQFSYILLMIVWLLIWFAAVATIVSAFRLRRSLRHATIRPNETRVRSKRAMWTAKVTLAMALFGLLITALVGYESVTILAWRMHGTPVGATTSANRAEPEGGFNIFPLVRQGQPLPLIAKALVGTETTCPVTAPYDAAACSKRFFQALIAQSGTAGLPIALAFAGLSLLLISWFIVLVAVTSVREPKSQSVYAQNVGAWVTDGFRWLHAAGSVLVMGLAFALSYGLVDTTYKLITGNLTGFLPGMSTDRAGDTLVWLAIALLASSATLAAARVRVALIASRARPALGILLDVDNYLRESPQDATPRATIMERFGSLMEHVVTRKARDGSRYFDRILIVSHSQGTVIAADFLRFLTLAGVKSPNLAGVDVRLLTMGSPLRQLYSVHFPHLYDWVDGTDDHGDGGKPDDDSAAAARSIVGPPLIAPPLTIAPVLNELSPSPRWLRVSQWVNLFTAGDYVGRPLWQRDDTPNVWKYDPHDKAIMGNGRRERCLGDGTHTRYWTSLDVAEEIDDLIAAP